MNPIFTFDAFSAAAKAQEQHAGMTFKDGEPIFTLQCHGQTRELSTKEAIDFLAQFEDEQAKTKDQREKAKKHTRPEPDERPFLGSLGDCMVAVSRHSPKGYAKITAVESDALVLHLEPATAAMLDAPVTIFIRSGVAPEHAREILKEAARCLKTYDTLDPWTPQEFLKSTPFDDGVPF